ncbi:MAG TPA: flagellar biosynthetic protein FliR [Bryobacteraceae bacterium]|nr:flagellar biosynthetic protein FliR [Bryobacteraceae bacterium]HOL72529.1 flagellar biosynthetic protein FliR [Bryobacteraceae bacterium]HOQ44191.1 flagellar biosynthetic protein FliR [Bryobacteraceae bacterium]HPQ14668.1 flagellar biosynthetic protein FliR [Bryobacteraceae bacterium]HPU70509.1 flagellar biosynthetic protein FliR [Bryobacteraceae bacterium]
MPGEVTAPLGLLLGFLLVLARVGGAFVFVPLPGVNQGPQMVRAVLAVSATIALFPVWPEVPVAGIGIGQLLVWMISEAAFGVTAGVAVAFLVETLILAAQAFAVQAGYSYASTIDPTTQADSNVLVVFAHLTAGLLFFALGLDRQVLAVFARSLAVYPPGTYQLYPGGVEAVLKLGGAMFTTGLRLAMPVIVLLMLVDIALALLGRIHMQLQLLTLAFPVKMLATLAFFAVVTAFFVPVFRDAAERTVAVLRGGM